MSMTEQRLEISPGLAPRPLRVGHTTYDISAWERAVFPARSVMAYVLDPVGGVRILLESGQLDAPAELADQLRAEFFSDQSG